MPLPSSPDAIPQAFADAWNARDPDALAALFDSDATFVSIVGLWWHDREAIRAAHAYGLRELFSESRLRVGRRVVKDLAPGVALVQARMRLDGQTALGGVAQPGVRHTVFSFVAREITEAGRVVGWRCASGHNTDVVAGAETHIRDTDGRLLGADYRSGRVSS
ncbi:MAG: SgcJ/EcaC family oxidoreductase [Bacteroidota bacterium]